MVSTARTATPLWPAGSGSRPDRRDEAVHHVRVLFMLLDRRLARLRRAGREPAQDQQPVYEGRPAAGLPGGRRPLFGPAPGRRGCRPAISTPSAAPRPSLPACGAWGGSRIRPASTSASRWTRSPPTSTTWTGRATTPSTASSWAGRARARRSGAQALAWRMAEQGVQVVLLEPQGHSRRLRELAGGKQRFLQPDLLRDDPAQHPGRGLRESHRPV
jgi:hypothetical protein